MDWVALYFPSIEASPGLRLINSHLETKFAFPPRHPVHLPDVVDEPAVAEYGPQHQSTCGMVFNEGVNGGPSFGPAHWQGDALICGESRGKIWRTTLVKSPEGYISKTHLIACLNALTVDACVTPQGHLLVACHTGPPDWGTGPGGDGRLFLIRYKQKEVPQPVISWAAAADEFRIAFDRPLDPEEWRGAGERIRIEAGEHVRSGDRFETLRPGYQVVRDQMATPRRWVGVSGLSIAGDLRTLVLRVPPQSKMESYAVTLPLPKSWTSSSPIPQVAEMDVLVDLHGVEARAGSGPEGLGMILPHVSFDVSRRLTHGSSSHEAFLSDNHGELLLRTKVNTGNIFQPATQPGTVMDWDVAADPFASRRMSVRTAGTGQNISETGLENGWAVLEEKMGPGSNLVLDLDGMVRPLPVNRFLLPWANSGGTNKGAEVDKVRTDVAGNWLHGRRLYFGKSTCATCHTIRGEGMACGPDLSNLIHRDRKSVMEDIVNPSGTINPDHAATLFTLKDGSSAAGIVIRSDADKVLLALPAGSRQEISRADILSESAMRASLMPMGLNAALTETELEDLLTFLLTVPLEPASIARTDPGPPPARKLSDVSPHIPVFDPSAKQLKPMRILLSAGEKDHGVDEHDYPLWLERWSTLLKLADQVEVDTCLGFPPAEKLATADVVVFYSANAGWNLRAAMALDGFQKKGGGLVYLHWAIEGHQHAAELAERVGLAFSFSAFRHGEMDLVFTPVKHPVTAGFMDPIRFVDESYWRLHGDLRRLSVLATSEEDGEARPQLWSAEKNGGRVFGCIPGHYTWTFDDPLYRVLILRGICWAAWEGNVHRLSELSLVGARITP